MVMEINLAPGIGLAKGCRVLMIIGGVFEFFQELSNAL